MQLVPRPPGRFDRGQVMFRKEDGSTVDLLRLSEKQMRAIRGNDIAMIFQEPMTSLNPVYSVGDQIVESITLHRGVSAQRARSEAIQMLERVGIPGAARRIDDYPHQMSGGMRQRVMIAMALACEPKLLIADEPTTALDVTIQAQVLDLMKDLVAEFGMGILFITHDLGVIAQTADRVAVMYLGRLVEMGGVRQVLRNPLHPYTRGLLAALPSLDALDAPLTPVPGDIPGPLERPSGCVFQSRCAEKLGAACAAEVPEHVVVAPGHGACCLRLHDSREAAQ